MQLRGWSRKRGAQHRTLEYRRPRARTRRQTGQASRNFVLTTPGWYRMLPLSPKSRAHTAFFSSRYRQTTVQRHCNSFHCCKCLKQIFAVNRFFGHQTRHHAKCDTELCLAVINAATSEPARDPAEGMLFPRFRIVSEQGAAPRCPLLGSDAAGLGAGSA